MDLSSYNVIIINSSAGKDSLCSIFEICRMAKEQKYPLNRIFVSHQDLGTAEWKGTKELAKIQADFFGIEILYSKRRDKNGYEETLLEYVQRRGKWPSNKQRYCTSDFKRGPGGRIVTQLSPSNINSKVLYVFGFRAEESPHRANKQKMSLNRRLTTKKRTVHEYYPIHHWNTERVWSIIRSNNLPYHKAYDLGMPRLSCCFCIFSSFDALVIAGYHNPELLEEYVKVEETIGHSFKADTSLKQIQNAIQKGYMPGKVSTWLM